MEQTEPKRRRGRPPGTGKPLKAAGEHYEEVLYALANQGHRVHMPATWATPRQSDINPLALKPSIVDESRERSRSGAGQSAVSAPSSTMIAPIQIQVTIGLTMNSTRALGVARGNDATIAAIAIPWTSVLVLICGSFAAAVIARTPLDRAFGAPDRSD